MLQLIEYSDDYFNLQNIVFLIVLVIVTDKGINNTLPPFCASLDPIFRHTVLKHICEWLLAFIYFTLYPSWPWQMIV